MIVARADVHEAERIADTVDWFCEVSGQRKGVNLDKSKVWFGRLVNSNQRRQLSRSLGMKESRGPVRYLGVVMDGKRVLIREFDVHIGQNCQQFRWLESQNPFIRGKSGALSK